MRSLLVAGLVLAVPLLFGSAAADPPPEPMPWCDLPLGSQDPVLQLVLDAAESAGDDACHAHACIAYSYGKLALIRQCLGV